MTLAIFIKTIVRDRPLFNTVASIERFAGPLRYRLYIADDGPVSSAKDALYARLSQDGHEIALLPPEWGVSRCRNHLIDRLKDEDFVLRMDDDFEWTAETRIDFMMRILVADAGVGAVAGLERQIGDARGLKSGEISRTQGLMWCSGGTLFKKQFDLDQLEYRIADGVRYCDAGFTRNMLLIRRRALAKTRWDDRLKFAREHEDFMLQLRADGWRLAFTPDSMHDHREDLSLDAPPVYRDRVRTSRPSKDAIGDPVFAEKWGVSRARSALTLGERLSKLLRRRLGRLGR